MTVDKLTLALAIIERQELLIHRLEKIIDLYKHTYRFPTTVDQDFTLEQTGLAQEVN